MLQGANATPHVPVTAMYEARGNLVFDALDLVIRQHMNVHNAGGSHQPDDEVDQVSHH